MTIRFTIFGVELWSIKIEVDHSPTEPPKPSTVAKVRKSLAHTLIR